MDSLHPKSELALHNCVRRLFQRFCQMNAIHPSNSSEEANVAAVTQDTSLVPTADSIAEKNQPVLNAVSSSLEVSYTTYLFLNHFHSRFLLIVVYLKLEFVWTIVNCLSVFFTFADLTPHSSALR